MPRYQITDSASGRTLVIEGDSPPSGQEAAQLFATAGTAPAPAAAPVAAAPNWIDRALGRSPEQVARSADRRRSAESSLRTYGDMGLSTLPQAEQGDAMRFNAALASRIGAPVGAAIATGGVGLVPLLATAATAGAGEGAAQMIESGRITSAPEMAKSSVLGLVPGSNLSNTGRKALMQMLGTGAADAAKFASAELAGETLKRSMEAGKFETFNSLGEAMKQAAVPAGLGMVVGAGARGAAIFADARRTRAQNLATMAAGGVEQPALDLIFPSQKGLVDAMADINPSVQRMKLNDRAALLGQYERLTAGAPEHEAVYAQFRPYIGKLDEARAAVAQAEQNATQLRAAAEDAAKSAQATPAQIIKARAEAAQAELAALNADAQLQHQANANLGGLLDHDTMARKFTGTVGRLFQARKEIGAGKFAAAGIDEAAAIFPKEDLLKAAETGLARWKGTDMRARILSAIEEAGGADSTVLNLRQFRELRQQFTDRFAGVDPRQLDAYEAAGKAAYGSLTDASRRFIGATPGANLAAYDQAVAYWRDTAEAAASRYVRPLLAREPSENTFASLASDLASGKKAEVRAFNDFVASVATDAPDVARLASARLTQAVRNSFLQQARTATGIDAQKLTDSLLRAEGTFDIGALGFGSRDQIARWRQTFDDVGLRHVTEADLGRIFSSPEVQQAATRGQDMAAAMRPAAARAAYEQAVNEQTLARLAGLTEREQAAAAKAAQAAKEGDITLAERRAALAAIEADPIAQAFANKQRMGIPEVPGAGNSTGPNNRNAVTQTLLNFEPAEVGRFMGALRAKDASLADLVQRRLMGDVFQFFRPSNTPGSVWALDKAAVQQFFHPAPGSAEARWPEKIRAAIGAEAMDRLEQMAAAVAHVHDVERMGKVLTTDGSRTIYAGTAIARSSLPPGSSLAVQSTLRGFDRLIGAQRYQILAALAQNGKFQNAFWQTGGDLAQAFARSGIESTALLARDAALRQEVYDHAAEQRPAPGPDGLSTLTPEQARLLPPGNQFRTQDGRTFQR